MVAHFVYIIKCGDGTYYTGYAQDPEKRLEEHRQGKKGAKYTRGRGPLELVWHESYLTKEEAMRREYQIKQLSREEKIKLMEDNNSPSDKGVLYLCATPLGNLEDMTIRGIRILKEVDLIAAEDTRHTRKLLSHFDIHTPMTSYHQHNEATKSSYLIGELVKGKKIALVSDAGMPGISDPGSYVIQEAIIEGIQVVPVPGPSAGITALVISGLNSDKFIFEGFLPSKKKDRMERLHELAEEKRTMIFYEAPHRIKDCLKAMAEVFGDRQIAAVKELTKIHEQAIRGAIGMVQEYFEEHQPKGEFVLVVEGSKQEKVISHDPWAIIPVEEHLRRMIEAGQSKKDAAKAVAKERGLNKKEVYKLAVDLEV